MSGISERYEKLVPPSDQEDQRKSLGIFWRSICLDVPFVGVRTAVFRTKKVLPEFIYDMSALEGNPYTFPEVQTLLQGVTVGGRRLSDQEQILTIRDAWHNIIKIVSEGRFTLSKQIFLETQALGAKFEALEQGMFRTMNVKIIGTTHIPPDHSGLEKIFESGLAKIEEISNAHERSYAFFLWASYHSFFSNGNKRTSRLIMAGELLSHGYDTPSIPVVKRLEFNQKMIAFYDSGDATEMMGFLNECLPG